MSRPPLWVLIHWLALVAPWGRTAIEITSVGLEIVRAIAVVEELVGQEQRVEVAEAAEGAPRIGVVGPALVGRVRLEPLWNDAHPGPEPAEAAGARPRLAAKTMGMASENRRSWRMSVPPSPTFRGMLTVDNFPAKDTRLRNGKQVLTD